MPRLKSGKKNSENGGGVEPVVSEVPLLSRHLDTLQLLTFEPALSGIAVWEERGATRDDGGGRGGLASSNLGQQAKKRESRGLERQQAEKRRELLERFGLIECTCAPVAHTPAWKKYVPGVL